MKTIILFVIGWGLVGFLISGIISYSPNTNTWNKPYIITLVDVTQDDLKHCQQDENCLDIMSIKELCTREEWGLDATKHKKDN